MSRPSLYAGIRAAFQQIVRPNTFYLSTWIAIGAVLLLIAQALSPVTHISTAIPLLFLLYRIAKTVIDTQRLGTGSFTSVKRGRWMVTVPESETAKGGSSGEVVAFLLGARINHPLGMFAPGAKEIGASFQSMWVEAKQEADKYGFLGHTSTLVDQSDSESTPFLWMSYWRDLDGLRQFANGPAHRAGQNAYNKGKYPHVGIMHELYYAPKNHWKALYDDFPPWGLGALKPAIRGKAGSVTREETLHPRSNPAVATISHLQALQQNA